MGETISRIFQVIEFLADSDDWVSLRTMSRELHINAAAAFRILNSLKELGYVRQHSQDSKYQLTLKIAGISAQVLEKVQLRHIAHPFLQQLTSNTNETTHLAILDGRDFVYIDKVDNSQAMRLRSRVGQRGLLHCTAVGKALLAHYPPVDLPQILGSIDFQPRTNQTITDPAKFQEQLELIRQQGYAVDDEENEIGIRCIGSPIYDHAGRLAGAVSISGWTISMTQERVPRLAQELRQTCLEVSQALGFTGAKESPGPIR
jgi:DNA-binding IclR family transcriptional regulator